MTVDKLRELLEKVGNGECDCDHSNGHSAGCPVCKYENALWDLAPYLLALWQAAEVLDSIPTYDGLPVLKSDTERYRDCWTNLRIMLRLLEKA